ncbi:MAG: AbrB/MazE/SpoVT family DNA-binding domain-containing protein [Alphaproteobacteria bacterium]|nr:AbrB/MazE/SpoVT family DNA-binding domain-containing protein [Alphaproteobacteria bacterium]
MKLQLKRIGNSTGLILPKELLARLNLEQGDEVIVSEGPEGFSVTTFSDDDEETMRLARDVIKEYRNTLKALAK